MKKFFAVLLIISLLSCKDDAEKPSYTGPPIEFAIIGDYGDKDGAVAEVADLVKSWNPEFIITVGDNNY